MRGTASRRLAVTLLLILFLECTVFTSAFDPYAKLQLRRDASSRDIKKAFRRLTRELHPDVVSDADKAKEQYADVLKAYGILDDPKKRQDYDQYGIIDDERTPPRRQKFNPFQQPRFKRIESSTRDLTITTWYQEVLPYRGAKPRIIMVYVDQSSDSHVFAPAWEHLAFRSRFRHAAEFLRVNAESDPLILDTFPVSINTYPTIVALFDGSAWPMTDLQVSYSTSSMCRQVEQFLSPYFADAVAAVHARTAWDVKSLEAVVRQHRYRRTVVAVNNYDRARFDQLVTSLLPQEDDVIVVPTPLAVLQALVDRCKPQDTRFRTTSVWVFHHNDQWCDAAKYPSGRLDDEDAIVRFVAKHRQKPVPVLTNHTFEQLCEAEGYRGCIIDVRRNEELAVAGPRALSSILPPQTKSQFLHATVDASYEVDFARRIGYKGHGAHDYFAVAITEDGFATTSGGPKALEAFGDRLIQKVQPFRRAPHAWWGLRTEGFQPSMYRTVQHWTTRIPMLNVLVLMAGWWVLHNVMSRRGGTAAPPADNDPQREPPRPAPQQPQGHTRTEAPSSTTARPTPSSQQSQPQGRRSTPYAPSKESGGMNGAPSSRGGASRAAGSSFQHANTFNRTTATSPPPTTSGTARPPQQESGGSRTYPGPGGEVPTAPTRKSIRALNTDDIRNATSRELLILLFSPGDGARAPREAARLMEYQDVVMRAMPTKYGKWWAWLKTHAPKALQEAAETNIPVIVAVRVRKGVAAIKPSDRSMQLWADSLLEGNLPLTLRVDPREATVSTVA